MSTMYKYIVLVFLFIIIFHVVVMRFNENTNRAIV